jgi:hypothetical protein
MRACYFSASQPTFLILRNKEREGGEIEGINGRQRAKGERRVN